MDPIAGFIAPGTTCDSLASEARMADRFPGAGYGPRRANCQGDGSLKLCTPVANIVGVIKC
jgi:hypothetical protein